ncbi:MAG: hypothetical protein R3B72_14020 [Polyangiaceae bacterium]
MTAIAQLAVAQAPVTQVPSLGRAVAGGDGSLTATVGHPTQGAPPDAQLQRAAKEFEQIFVRQLLESTKIGGNSGKGYGSMVVDAFAEAVTAGEGIGFGDQIARMLAQVHHQPQPAGTDPAIPIDESQPRTRAR